jgi:hypothetical protein
MLHCSNFGHRAASCGDRPQPPECRRSPSRLGQPGSAGVTRLAGAANVTEARRTLLPRAAGGLTPVALPDAPDGKLQPRRILDATAAASSARPAARSSAVRVDGIANGSPTQRADLGRQPTSAPRLLEIATAGSRHRGKPPRRSNIVFASTETALAWSRAEQRDSSSGDLAAGWMTARAWSDLGLGTVVSTTPNPTSTCPWGRRRRRTLRRQPWSGGMLAGSTW